MKPVVGLEIEMLKFQVETDILVDTHRTFPQTARDGQPLHGGHTLSSAQLYDTYHLRLNEGVRKVPQKYLQLNVAQRTGGGEIRRTSIPVQWAILSFWHGLMLALCPIGYEIRVQLHPCV